MSPYLISLPKIGNPGIGYLSVAEKLPFDIKRVYWTYHTPEDITRGGHSHNNLHQLLIAVSGTVTVFTELKSGESDRFVLDNPSKGLYIPPGCWRNMKYTHNAVQLCMASNQYDESDYIRSYEQFKK